MDDVSSTNPYQAPASSPSPPSSDSKPRLVEVLFSFHGRVRRRTFWECHLSFAVIVIFVITLQPFLFTPVFRPNGPPALFARLSPLGMIVIPTLAVLILWIGAALGVKRFHDQGKSGRWILVGIIPPLGTIWLLLQCGFLPGTEGPNTYGSAPT